MQKFGHLQQRFLWFLNFVQPIYNMTNNQEYRTYNKCWFDRPSEDIRLDFILCHLVCLLYILYSADHICAIWCVFSIYNVLCITNYDLCFFLSNICAALPIPVMIWHLINHSWCSLILIFWQNCRVRHPSDNIRLYLKVCYLMCLLHILNSAIFIFNIWVITLDS